LYKILSFFTGFIHPHNPPSGFDAPIPATSSMYVPPTTPSHTPNYPDGFSPYNPPATAATPNDGGMNSLSSFGNYNPTSTGNGGSSFEGTV
jgi:hypothetical protein